MPQRGESIPTFIAIGLALLAAVMSSPRYHADVDAALLELLTLEAGAIDMPQADPKQPAAFTSP